MSNTATGWKVIRPALISVFTRIATDQITGPGGIQLPLETPPWVAEWRDRKVTLVHPGQGHSLYLNITSVVSRGWDDQGFSEIDTGIAAGNAPTGITDVYQTTSGLRKFMLRVESHVGEDTEELSSMSIIERIRHRIAWDSSIQELLAANVDVTDIGLSRDLTRTVSKKKWSVTSLDVTFTACVIDTDPIPTGYFNRIILTSHEQVADTDIEDSLRTINKTLPP